jgi:regulator of protease activity HflC (stomatin/prohibitin superfamily)
MNNNSKSENVITTFTRHGGGTVILIVLAIFLLFLAAILSFKFGKITGEEVGVMLNKITGKTEVITESGVKIYNGITHELYILDKTVQTLDMTEDVSQGDRKEKDDLKIKTIDGSDVYVDLKIQYQIIPDMADVVIKSSGPGNNYKIKWARDYVRSMCRNSLGELTTEEFYDASKRDLLKSKAMKKINEHIEKFGIIITDIIIPSKPHFYKEYEDLIKQKKLADQAVLEEESKALAAKELQKTLVVKETNLKNVAIEQFKGMVERKLIDATAAGEKARQAADAYYDKITIDASATYYKKQKDSEAVLAKKKAEATGIEALKKALEGEGGRNMVKMEYAKKLKDIIITGQPYRKSADIGKFEINQIK